MSIQRIDSNPRLSGAVIQGGLVYLSGQVPTDRSLDCAGQTREVLAKIDDLLARSGTDKTRLLTAQIWLKDIATDFSAMNEVWTAWLPQDSAPARATIQAPLASEDVLVEIMLTAALPE